MKIVSEVELFRVCLGLVSFRIAQRLRALLGPGKLTWAVGADVFEGMKHWADKARPYQT